MTFPENLASKDLNSKLILAADVAQQIFIIDWQTDILTIKTRKP